MHVEREITRVSKHCQAVKMQFCVANIRRETKKKKTEIKLVTISSTGFVHRVRIFSIINVLPYKLKRNAYGKKLRI